MRTSKCRWVRSRLPLLAGGELFGPERRLVERHLLGCAACREQRAGLGASLAVLHETAEVDPLSRPPGLWPVLERQIREARRPLPEEVSWSRRMLVPVAGLAAALTLSATVGLLAVRWDRARSRDRLVRPVVSRSEPRKIRKATIIRPAAPPSVRRAAEAEPESPHIAVDAGPRAANDPPAQGSVGLTQ